MATFNHVSLTYNVTGQVVEVYPPQPELLDNGAPTAAATYAVYKGTQSNDEAAQFSGTASLDSVSTTVDAASGYSQTNRQKLNLTATTGIAVGRRYLVENVQGQREIVIPTQIVSADYILVEEPLCYDYAASDTFKGLRQYFTVDATFIQDSSNLNALGSNPLLLAAAEADIVKIPPFRVKWSYTTGSVAQITWTTFDVVRQPAKSTITAEDLRAIFPDVIFQEWIAQRGQDFTPQLEAAVRDCRLAARVAKYDPDSIRDPEMWDRMVLQKWAVVIGKGMLAQGADITEWLNMAISDDTRLFEKCIGTALNAYTDTTGTGGATVAPTRQMWLGSR